MSVPSEPVETPLAPKRRGTLLIVDDEEGPRMSLKLIFKENYDLLMADDGAKAIDLAQQNPIDVVILDIRMAGMSGIETLERLRLVQPDLQAIIITAFETTETMRQALRLRACDYINKPFDLATIRNAVSEAMKRRLLESDKQNSGEQVRELLADLQNQKVEGQIAQTRGDIYASIIHDINGPLSVTYGFVQVLIQKLKSKSHLEAVEIDFIRERLGTIERQVSNCIEIQRRYLGFLRRQRDDSAPASVNQLLHDLESIVRVHPSRQENEFSLTPLAGEIGVKVNGTDIIQIVLNLTVNAFQCTSMPHRVEIGGEVLIEPLDLTQFKDGPHDRLLNVESMENTAPLVKLWVRDTGPGIPLEVLPKIFQSYFTTKGPNQGTGLGLNIVQRLIKEGHGALHCHTEPGKGTTFTVYLPGANLAK
jgi:signal transduction histidine kinase